MTSSETSSGSAWYECMGCGQRGSYGEKVSTCPSCGGEMKNVGVPQE